MKKTLLLLLVVFVFVTLAGCQEKESFTLKLLDLDGEVLVDESIYFEEDDQRGILELIEASVDIDYDTFDFGVMVNGIEGYYPKEYGASYNYYYQILVDGVASDVGISEIDYTKDMVLSFVEISSLLTFDQMIDDLIYDFIDNNLDNYLSDEFVDYMVLSSLNQLVNKGYIDLDFNDYYTYDNLDLKDEVMDDMTLGDLLKAGPVYKLESMNLDSYKTKLSELDISNPYAATSYLEALYIAGDMDHDIASDLMDEVVNDPDFAGMALMALAPYSELEGFDDYLDSVETYLATSLTSTGIESWGGADFASTATVILGLVANGINPESEAYMTDGVGLVEALMLYVDGYNFKWQLESEEADLAFSTPQAFAALVAYKLSRDVWGFAPTNIFNFS